MLRLQVGVQIPRPIADADAGEFRRFLQVHVEGTFTLVRRVSAAMICQDLQPNGSAPSTDSARTSARGGTRGSIVTLASANSFVATPHMVQYTTAKHALLGLTRNAGPYIHVRIMLTVLCISLTRVCVLL